MAEYFDLCTTGDSGIYLPPTPSHARRQTRV